MSRLGIVLVTAMTATLMAGCAPSTKAVMETSQSAVALRSFQQRAFDTSDKEKTLRTVIATLQDLSFVVDKADMDLGTVSATKLSGYQLRMTVTVRPRNETQMLVRANAQYMDKAVEEPKPYQDFFVALEKSMFLTAHQVD
jgi:hypothetical protein